VLRCCGITRKDGIVAHGLRHGYANRPYQDLTGVPTPVRGGMAEAETDSQAREQVAEELGHGRTQITKAYCGARDGGSATAKSRKGARRSED
jgi:hypothetical protein